MRRFFLTLVCLAVLLQGEPARAVASFPDLSSTIGFPLEGAHFPAGAPITIEGGARGPSPVALVEVSTDGGSTWVLASGASTWSYTWTPALEGAARIRSRARDILGSVEPPNAGIAIEITAPEPPACPCTIWPLGTTPAITDDGATDPLEVGVRFHADVDGVIEAIRFYKTARYSGHHTANLWTAGGQLLGTAEFDTALANGWHDVSFETPIPLQRDSAYIASVFMPMAHYALDPAYFYPVGVDHPPLHAPANRTGAGNGVYSYGTASSFPDSTYNQSNYWVDVRFNTPGSADDTPPRLTAISPLQGELAAPVDGGIRATFSERIDAASLTDSSFTLFDGAGALVPAMLEYSVVTRTATLTPVPLEYGAPYRVRIAADVRDPAGNPLGASSAWSFTTAHRPEAPPDDGPGGPILVLASTANPFTRYVPEILRAEGLNEFSVRELAGVDASTLAACDVAILGETPVNSEQAAMLTAWVEQGGNLIAFRPDVRLQGLFGLAGPAGVVANQYLRVETGSSPGAGIVGETMQFHGAADRYDLVPGSGARAVAWLYASATGPTLHPAVTLRPVGANGGEVAAFTYDLARSVVYTRQGNPAWAGQERDGLAPRSTVDLFYGAAAFDPQPEWLDFTKVAIPQADEQQRLLVNLVLAMTADRAPLPRFWYFPRGAKAAIVMTCDDHGSFGVTRRFDRFLEQSDPDCSVDDWECVRGTAFLYPGPSFTDAQAQHYEALGFETAPHVTTNCLDLARPALAQKFDQDLALFAATYPSLPAPVSNRTHCVAWADYASEAEIEAARGIRFDTNYYFSPAWWVRDTPGLYTGSGIPMRMARADGTLIDCYQSTTVLTDDAQMSIPHNVDVLLDRALGSEGWYGAFTCNAHVEFDSDHVADDIIASAQAHHVPVVSARQMLTWIDGRGASRFRDRSWDGSTLEFAVEAGAGARNLQALLPLVARDYTLRELRRDGQVVSFAAEGVKGVACARFDAPGGTYRAQYSGTTTGGGGPTHLELEPIVPNPALGDVRFAFELPARGPVQLGIFGVRGNLVRTIARGTHAAGRDAVLWDRRDRFGQSVPPGVYVARLEFAGRTATRRLVLLVR